MGESRRNSLEQQAKTSHLLALSAQFDIQYHQITDTLRNEDSEISTNVKKIESLQTLYKITEEFTIWPFDVGNLRRFLAITLAPLSPGVFTVIFEFVRTFMMHRAPFLEIKVKRFGD